MKVGPIGSQMFHGIGILWITGLTGTLWVGGVLQMLCSHLKEFLINFLKPLEFVHVDICSC